MREGLPEMNSRRRENCLRERDGTDAKTVYREKLVCFRQASSASAEKVSRHKHGTNKRDSGALRLWTSLCVSADTVSRTMHAEHRGTLAPSRKASFQLSGKGLTLLQAVHCTTRVL